MAGAEEASREGQNFSVWGENLSPTACAGAEPGLLSRARGFVKGICLVEQETTNCALSARNSW